MTGFPQGGCVAVPRRTLIAASTNATLVRSVPTALQGMVAVNTGTAAAYLKLYDTAAAPVPGAGTPVMTVPLPVNQPVRLDTSVAFLTPVLVYTARSRGGGEAPLLYGLGFTVTGAVGDADTTAAPAGGVVNLLIGS